MHANACVSLSYLAIRMSAHLPHTSPRCTSCTTRLHTPQHAAGNFVAGELKALAELHKYRTLRSRYGADAAGSGTQAPRQ